jgi:3-oxoacyl-[acyl-carrier-protein] synthase II
MGTLNAVGNDVATSWNALLKGVSGIGPIDRFDASDLAVTFAGQIKGFDATTVFEKKEVRRLDPFLHYAMAAAIEAIEGSGLQIDPALSHRYGVMFGTGIAGANMASGLISIRYGLRGPNTCVVTACTTGTHAIGDAYRIVQRGEADAMVAGGSEAPVTPPGVVGFINMKALSRRNDDPQHASRPFDRGRDGFVMAEGAGAMVLESLEHALTRGAPILGEIVGYGMSGDAHHMTAPHEEGIGAQLAMRNAIADAQIQPTDIDYINAHGTSTPYNDRIETYAIKQVFGEHAYKLAVSSTKSMTGHALGGAGGMEAIFTAMALREGKLPPTINQFESDPDCDLDYVPNEMREASLRVALSNSFGFGGTNGCLALARYEEEAP